MKSKNMREPLVLSIFFSTRGFGYALFEDVLATVDWGIKRIKDKKECLEQVRLLLLSVVEDRQARNALRETMRKIHRERVAANDIQ